MARLVTTGFESGIPSGTATQDGESNGVTSVNHSQVGTVAYQTSVARNGGRAMSCAASGANYSQIAGLTHTVDVPTYARFYFRFTAAPSTTSQLFAWRLNGTVVASLDLLTTRAMRLNVPASGSAGNSSVLSVDTWYRIETSLTIPASGNGSVELKIDGVTAVGPSAGNVGTTLTTTTHRIGHVTAADTGAAFYFDDLAINDGNGASQNSWPGAGNITLLGPLADSAKGTGWEAPQTTGSDTTDLYQAVDNVPPIGVAHSDVDANANAYAFNAANLGAASEYRVICLAPIGVLPAGAPIMLSQAYMRASCDSTTGTNNMELQGITPADSAVTCNVELTAVAGTEPTGWKSFRTAVSYRPSLALTDVPVVEATKILTGAARAHMVDQMGLLVEWRTPVEASAAMGATAAIASSGEFEAPSFSTVERSASLGATAAVASTGTFWTVLERSTSLAATAAVASTGTFWTTFERSTSVAATVTIATSSYSVRIRSAAFAGTGLLSVSAHPVHVRSASLGVAGLVDSAGQLITSRSATLGALVQIASSGAREIPSWGLDTGEQWPATEGDEWPAGEQPSWSAQTGAAWSHNDGEEW